MLSCKFYNFLLVFKITKGCCQDFSLLQTLIHVIDHLFFYEKWLTLNVLSPKRGFQITCIQEQQTIKKKQHEHVVVHRNHNLRGSTHHPKYHMKGNMKYMIMNNNMRRWNNINRWWKENNMTWIQQVNQCNIQEIFTR
jgi:hypothetical protein